MNKPRNIRQLFLPIAVVLFYLLFVLYYLMHSHQDLLQDYLKCSACFFRLDDFQKLVFTSRHKHQGNILAMISIPILFVFVRFCFVHFDTEAIREAARQQWCLYKAHFPWMAALIILCVRLFAYAYQCTAICTDEVFSAYNFAQMPLAHLLSYYPIPNNHLLYSVLQHFCGSIFGNYVQCGRFISGFFYIALLLGSYMFLARRLGSQLLAFLCCVLLAMQFVVWGFGSQARGYALSYWLQWLSFVAFYYYFFTAERRQYLLLLMVFANVLGFWVLPTFVYVFVLQALMAMLVMLRRRQFYLPFCYAMFASLMGAFLLYLPVFCYSGIDAVVANKYIASTGLATGHLLQLFAQYFTQTILTTLFALPLLGSYWLWALCALAIILGLFKALPQARHLTMFYLLNFCTLVVVLLLMQHLTNLRAIGFQLHLALLLFLCILVQRFASVLLRFKALKTLSIAIVATWSFAYFAYFVQHQSTLLYDQDTAHFAQLVQPVTQQITAHSEVWVSDESFYFRHLLQGHARLSNYNCQFAQQSYIIISEDDKPIPQLQLSQYQLIKTYGWFSLYQHR